MKGIRRNKFRESDNRNVIPLRHAELTVLNLRFGMTRGVVLNLDRMIKVRFQAIRRPMARDKERIPMRIVFGGPKHSGKSVLLWYLKKLVAAVGDYMPLRCAPDGEGDWTQELYLTQPDLALEIRQKGQFSEEFVSWAEGAVKNCDSRFGLIDVGGIPSAENKRICKHADALVIVISDQYGQETHELWVQFAKELGLKVLGTVHSTLNSVEEWSKTNSDSKFEGLAVGLDRKTFKGSITVETLAKFLTEKTKTEKKEKQMNTITIAQIASMIGKQPGPISLPGGKTITGLDWKPEELPMVEAALKPFSAMGTPWFVDGAGPQWLIACITHALHPCSVALADSKVEGGQVQIGERKLPEGTGKGDLTFSVEEKEAGAIVRYQSANPIDFRKLSELVPPATTQGKSVFLNGRTATWGVVEIAACYQHVVPAVFVGQPMGAAGYCYVCAITHSPDIKVGSVVKEADLK
ncbi:MAG: hypothetical protein PHS62_02815 [Patescibacteria group bacterium]|nr:hypothetical protein [Patescibacteria group bacterium]